MCEAKSSTRSHTLAVAVRLPARRGLFGYQGNQPRATPLPPFDQHRLRPGCRTVSPAPGTRVEQALVGQGLDGDQEDSHLEWPDHTDTHPSLSV